jgi:hypothetical protein
LTARILRPISGGDPSIAEPEGGPVHAIHPDPRLLLAALVALLLAVAALAASPLLSDVELGGGSPPVAERAQPVAGPSAPPAWAADPLAPPPLLR